MEYGLEPVELGVPSCWDLSAPLLPIFLAKSGGRAEIIVGKVSRILVMMRGK